MKEITILSGKGGSGKTSVTAALASVAERAVFCDNDVDAADLHIVFQPEIIEQHSFSSGWHMLIDSNRCTGCSKCVDLCRFDALSINKNRVAEVNNFQCEGCRLCERVCPENAISSERKTNNYWFVSNSRFGHFVHAQMGPGEENSGKLVAQVRQKAAFIAGEKELDYIINDGPPGIGCAAISSLSGAHQVLLVIEATNSGLHDAKRLLELTDQFEISTVAVINKSDISINVTRAIEEFLQSKKVPLLAKIPYDSEVVQSMNEGKTIVEYNPDSSVSKQIHEIWNTLKELNNDTLT